MSPEFNAPIVSFLDAVDHQQPDDTFSLLAGDVQQQIERQDFSQAVTLGDFDLILQMFKAAGIKTRNPDPHQEFRVRVSKLRGQQGDVIFVMSKSNGVWKIANIVEP